MDVHLHTRDLQRDFQRTLYPELNEILRPAEGGSPFGAKQPKDVR